MLHSSAKRSRSQIPSGFGLFSTNQSSAVMCWSYHRAYFWIWWIRSRNLWHMEQTSDMNGLYRLAQSPSMKSDDQIRRYTRGKTCPVSLRIKSATLKEWRKIKWNPIIRWQGLLCRWVFGPSVWERTISCFCSCGTQICSARGMPHKLNQEPRNSTWLLLKDTLFDWILTSIQCVAANSTISIGKAKEHCKLLRTDPTACIWAICSDRLLIFDQRTWSVG